MDKNQKLLQFRLVKTEAKETDYPPSPWIKPQEARESNIPLELTTPSQRTAKSDVHQLLIDTLYEMLEGCVLTLSITDMLDRGAEVLGTMRKTEATKQTPTNALSPDDCLAESIYSIVYQHIENESLTIDDVAHELAMSRSQLFRKVRTLIGTTPAQLIRDCRLDAARRLFESDKSKRVSEVMFAVGFNDAKHFGQIFKQRFGVSPQAMKNEGRIMSVRGN